MVLYKHILIISVFLAFFSCLTMGFSQGTQLPVTPKDAVEAELDFNLILAGVKHYDGIVQSGEGKCTHTFGPLGMPEAHTTNAYLTFDSQQTRMDLDESVSSNKMHWSKTSIVVTTNGTWEIIYNKKGEPSYYFRTEIGLDPLRIWVDPRRWLRVLDKQDLPTYLKERNFRIIKVETFNDTSCYVIEGKKNLEFSSNQQEDVFERFWISPEHGFRYLKYENRFLRKRDTPDGKIKKNTPSVRRVTLSYGIHAEDVWFIKSGMSETFWIDSEGKEHLVSKSTIKMEDFTVNHDISSKIFTVEIPDDAMIYVNELRKKLSKTEFLERYGKNRNQMR